ncbi:hypothetical protein M3Y98_00809000 [Aphelenchoides besseyi]|nr:hypothetical protein M3Y98_00809000 [Aphelenchoides besseyi]KAI6212113.1 hypothetical protein M3Y96_00506100 [Aphelenchoides besseyi]
MTSMCAPVLVLQDLTRWVSNSFQFALPILLACGFLSDLNAMMLVRSLLLSFTLLFAIMCNGVQAFDSTEIRLLEWPNGPKAFTKRADILDLGIAGPLARFRKSNINDMNRMIRSQDFMKDPIIRFGKRSGGQLSRGYRLITPDY